MLTRTTTPFIQPIKGDRVTVTVESPAEIRVDDEIRIAHKGFYRVIAVQGYTLTLQLTLETLPTGAQIAPGAEIFPTMFSSRQP